MIKANELRIGNLIYPISTAAGIHIPATGIILRVVEIADDSVKTIHHDQNILKVTRYHEFGCTKISPIPLTPEILQACGFEAYENKHFLRKSIAYLQFTGGKYYMIKASGVLLKAIEFLHELQNFYFELNRIELVYNPIKELT